MKKIIVTVLVLVAAFTVSTDCFARGGNHHVCGKQSSNMNAADAIVWTMANPNECDMDFLGYSREIKNDFEKLTPAEKKRSLMKKLIQKHVNDLEMVLSKRIVYKYSRAFDYEEYFQTLVFFKRMGYKTSADETALRMHLQNRFKEACEHVVSMMRSEKKSFMIESYKQDIDNMMNKWGIAYQDFGTTEIELINLTKK